MSLLSKKKRQEYLKYLGFYKGEIDGKVGPLTKQAYIDLQACYFDRKKDIDGKYGKDTDILLRNAYNVKKYCKDFKLSEFKCGCGRKYCTGYPAVIDPLILHTLQLLRNEFGKTIVTSGLRCKKYNSKLVGSSKNSRHLLGKAADFKCDFTSTKEGRKFVKKMLNDFADFRYIYSDTPNMGTAIHFDID